MKKMVELVALSALMISMTSCGITGKDADQIVQENKMEEEASNEQETGNVKDVSTEDKETTTGSVIVKVTEDITLDIANDDPKQIIKTLNNNDGFLYYSDESNIYSVDDTETVYVENLMKRSFTGQENPELLFSFDLERIPNTEMAKLGYIIYSLQNDDVHSCKGLSLFPGWDGTMSEVDSYLNDDNSVLLENHLTISQRIAVFKNGEIVPIEELLNTYGDKAKEISEYDQLIDYFDATEMTYDNNVGMNCVPGNFISDMQNGKHSVESIAMYCALFDWGTEYEEGARKDFGIIYWYPELEGIQVTIASSIDDYSLLRDAKEKE